MNFILNQYNILDKKLLTLIGLYDDHVYSPLQKVLMPVVKRTPRYANFRGEKISIFDANNVTLLRTFLIIPISWFLKFDYNVLAFLMVALHDFLDHLDGIVAKAHREIYPNVDDPLLGGFLDAFCDKIVNTITLLLILQTADISCRYKLWAYAIIFYAVIGYEVVIGVIRVQDYYKAKYSDDPNLKKGTAATMEGKLKEKLESIGIACLCFAINKNWHMIINDLVGYFGLFCLLLSLTMAHKSLKSKLDARSKQK